MANPDGSFIWYELMTTDADAAKPFYDAVVGWTVDRKPEHGMDYRMINTGDGLVGGVMTLDEQMKAGGARPAWVGYLGVSDVDGKADQVAQAGGRILVPPTDIPDVGRFAMVTDPAGAPFYIMRGDSPEDSHAFAPGRRGHCGWNELYTSDQGTALDFYGRLFGMEKTGAMDMGEMGDYTFLAHAGKDIGAMMTAPPDRPPAWNFYFQVADIPAAVEKIGANGGTVLHGPHVVPTGDRIVIASDPQGAVFSLVGPGEAGAQGAAS